MSWWHEGRQGWWHVDRHHRWHKGGRWRWCETVDDGSTEVANSIGTRAADDNSIGRLPVGRGAYG